MPVLDAEAHIVEQLDALAAQDYRGRWELLVVDNGCRDRSIDLVRRFAPRLDLRVVDARTSRGINHARNRGLREAAGELVCFCDADDRVASSWLRLLAARAMHHDLVGGRLDETALNDGAPRRPRMPSDRLPLAMGFLPFAVGANLAVWRALAIDLGGFSEAFEIGNDDTDFALRAQLAGASIGFAPDAVVAYRHRRDLLGLFQQFRCYGRGEPLLWRRFRDAGMERDRWFTVARRWLGLLVPVLAPPSMRSGAGWVYTAGYTLGRLEGSLRHRVLYL